MKHLKRYNESSSDMISDLEYMLLDISDFGFYTHVGENQNLITITISRLKNHSGFIQSEEESNSLKEALNRIKDYGKSCGYLVDLTWIARLKNLTKEEFNKVISDNRFTMYITMYPKHL